MKSTFTGFIRDMKDTARGPLANDIGKIRSGSDQKADPPKSPKPPTKAKPVKLGKIQFWPPDTPANHLPLPTPPGETEPINPTTFRQFLKNREQERRKAIKKAREANS